MNILHVIPSMASSTGGPAFAVAGVAQALAALGCHVTIASTDLASPAQAKSARTKVAPDQLPPECATLDLKLFPVSRVPRVAYSPELSEYLHGEMRVVDVVHIHSLNLHPQYAAHRHIRTLSTPYVVSPHGALDPYIQNRSSIQRAVLARLWQQNMLDAAGFLHFGSSAERDRARPYHSNPRTIVIPNGVNIPQSGSTADRNIGATSPIDGNSAPLIINHGRITEKKGLDILIHAVAAAKCQIPRMRLKLVGPDDDGLTPRLQDIARQAGIFDSVTFTGALYGNELFEALRRADVWVLPSWSEGASMAVNEALSIGLPVIVSPQVSTAEEGANADALLVVNNSAQEVASAMTELLFDSDRRRHLQENARRFALELSWSAIAPRYVEMYECAIAAKRL